jgi:hypothetical protein
MSELTGGCACGAVRYRMQTGPMIVHCCHCLDCQRQTGSAFVLNALIEADRVEVTGEVAASPMPTDSGRTHEVMRCTECGVAVWSEYGAGPIVKFMRVGTLDEPAQLAPDLHIYTRTKQPWVQIPEGVRAFEAYYDSAQVWPAAALKRRSALFASA